MASIGILGAGSWGTALAVLLGNNGHQVTLWSHREQEARRLEQARENESKLPGVRLPDRVAVTFSLEDTMREKDVLILAVPSSQMRSTCRRIAPLTAPGQILVSVAKGIEDGTFATMTDLIREEIPGSDGAVLSGPSHAEEVGRGLPTTCVVGATTEKTAKYLQKIFMSPVFRVYISPDILGIELGGALKNVIALAAGIADGLGYGDNTKAALITRGIAEIARLGLKMGGRLETFSGLTGIGDLIVTCASVHSTVAKRSRIWVEGRHDAELVQHVWGEDLAAAGITVQLLEGVDNLEDVLEVFGPTDTARAGVLVDHMVPGSKESRIAEAVSARWPGAVLVLGHPFVDIWQAVKPERVGLRAWPDVPRGIDIKHGTLDALGWPHADQRDIAMGWKRILSTVRTYRDLEPALLGRVEELIDFVTVPWAQ